MTAIDAAGGPNNTDALTIAPPNLDPILIKKIELLFALSWLLGIDHAAPASNFNLADTPEALSFEEAVAFMKSRVPVTKDEWTAIEPKLRFRAFTVAALSSHDGVEQVRRMITSAVEEGESLSQFWTETRALEAAGLAGDSPTYWEIVFRTNIQTAYNAGRAAEFAREQPEYLEFVGIEDGRQTQICAARTGTILPATHPFWKNNWPPLHFRCRSTVRGVYQEEIDQLRADNPNWQPTDGDSLALGAMPTGKGFGGNPIETESFYQMTPSMVKRARSYGIETDISNFAKSLGLRYSPLELSSVAEKSGVLTIEKNIPGGNAARASLREEAKKYLLSLRDTTYVNKTLGESVLLDKTGIDHAVRYSGEPIKLSILDQIPHIIENTSAFSSEPDIKERPDFSEILRGKVVVKINKKRNLFSVVLRRRISDGKLVFYDVLPWENKKPG